MLSWLMGLSGVRADMRRSAREHLAAAKDLRECIGPVIEFLREHRLAVSTLANIRAQQRAAIEDIKRHREGVIETLEAYGRRLTRIEDMLREVLRVVRNEDLVNLADALTLPNPDGTSGGDGDGDPVGGTAQQPGKDDEIPPDYTGGRE